MFLKGFRFVNIQKLFSAQSRPILYFFYMQELSCFNVTKMVASLVRYRFNINKDLAFIILPFNADTGTTPRENNSVWEKQRIIHPLSTGEANIAYERQIAGKHSNNEFLKYCHQLNWTRHGRIVQTKSFITFLHLHLLCLVMVWDQGELYVPDSEIRMLNIWSGQCEEPGKDEGLLSRIVIYLP